MRRLLVLILMLSIIAQSFSKGLLLLSYYTNTGIYAVNCENKSRPQLQCNGKCQLSKKIQAEERKEQQEKRTAEPQIVYIEPQEYFQLEELIPALVFAQLFHPLSVGHIKSYAATIFHPPSLV
jgi:hypothetical protein